MKLLSAIVPCYNEEENVPYFYEEFIKNEPYFEAHEIGFELWYIDDGSRDGTLSEIRKLQEKDPRVHYVSFSRNFGKEAALYAGFERHRGIMWHVWMQICRIRRHSCRRCLKILQQAMILWPQDV